MRISKMLAALLICVALVGANNTSQATKISGSKVSKVVEHVCFDTRGFCIIASPYKINTFQRIKKDFTPYFVNI